MKCRIAALLALVSTLANSRSLRAQPKLATQGEAITGWPETVNSTTYAYASGVDFTNFIEAMSHSDALRLAAMIDTGEVRQLAPDTQVLILAQDTLLLTRIAVLDGAHAREFLWISGGIQQYKPKWKPLVIRYKPNEWPGLAAKTWEVEGKLLRLLDDFIRVYDTRLKPKENNLSALGQEIRRYYWRDYSLWAQLLGLGPPDPDASEILGRADQIHAVAVYYYGELLAGCPSSPAPDLNLYFVPSTNDSFQVMRYMVQDLRHSLEISISARKEVEKKVGEYVKWPYGWIQNGDDYPCCVEPLSIG